MASLLPGAKLMPWFLSLHIMALVFWCGGLLLLPVLIRGLHKEGDPVLRPAELAAGRMAMPRFVFTCIATPAALLAIASGTAVFLLNNTLEVWLLLKLTLVAAIVVAHTLCGWLLLKAPGLSARRLLWSTTALLAAFVLLMTAVLWTVLSKPLSGLLP